MPLVDYASSDDESHSEPEITEEKEEKQTEKKEVVRSEESKKSADDENGELFSTLPKPRKVFSFLEDDNKLNKLLHKSSLSTGKKESIKITVPSISEFENEAEEPPPKKIKPSMKGAGLFSVLPPPKNNSVKATTRSLVPQVVSQNQFKQSAVKSTANNKDLNRKLTKVAVADDEDDDDDVPVGSSFFGSSLVEQHDMSESSETVEESIPIQETADISKDSGNSFESDSIYQGQISNPGLYINTDEEQVMYSTNSSLEPEMATADENPLELDEKALQILCGNKKKRHQMPMNIIDLSSEEVLPDSKEWLLKQFTEEKKVRSHSHRKSHGPSSQSRRKHQITYLAYQAKEQELELKNQWANNRMSRKQTQSKYGF